MFSLPFARLFEKCCQSDGIFYRLALFQGDMGLGMEASLTLIGGLWFVGVNER